MPLAASAAQGQELPGSEQGGNSINQSPDIIDGASHPELIPDSVAYRLFFVTVAEPLDTTDFRKARQRAYLRTAGLSDSDLDGAVQILVAFKAQLSDLVDGYNRSVEAANEAGEAPDLQTFMSQQADLVQRTRTALGSSLSPASSANLAAHIQREKRNMKVAKEDR